MEDYKDRWIDQIYIGRRSGFMDQLEPELQTLKAGDKRIIYGTPNQVINLITDGLGQHLSK